MASNRNNRKFDFSKSKENRFDFTKDEPDVVDTPQQPKGISPEPAPSSGGKSKTGKIVGGIAAVAAILAGVYFFGIKGDDKSGTDAGTPPTEQIAQAGDATQPEATTKTDVPEEGTAEEEGTATDAPETVRPAEASEVPAKTGKDQAQTPAQPSEQKADKPSSVASSATKPVQQAQSPKNNATTSQIAVASAPIGGDVVENAKRVIRGDFGNGQERKDKLGSAYAEIQSKVNEMYRQGLVY